MDDLCAKRVVRQFANDTMFFLIEQFSHFFLLLDGAGDIFHATRQDLLEAGFEARRLLIFDYIEQSHIQAPCHACSERPVELHGAVVEIRQHPNRHEVWCKALVNLICEHVLDLIDDVDILTVDWDLCIKF